MSARQLVASGSGTVLIPRRFRGPVDSGNGGYSAGVVAAALGRPLGPAQVTLRRPPPLDAALPATLDAGGIRVGAAEAPVAEGLPSELNLTPPEPVTFAEAAAASRDCPWLHDHPYPECFVCGTSRPDGLRIFPGPVPNRRVAAAPWVPDATVCSGGRALPEVVWAAVDCPSWFGFACFSDWRGLMLLGRFTAQVFRLPDLNEPCVSMGWAIGQTGRKHDTAAALHTAQGELLALSRAVWITLRDQPQPPGPN